MVNSHSSLMGYILVFVWLLVGGQYCNCRIKLDMVLYNKLI